MPFLKDLREKFSIEPMFLETLTSFLISTINPSTSFDESINAMPFSEPRTKNCRGKGIGIHVIFCDNGGSHRTSCGRVFGFGIDNMMMAFSVLFKIFLVVS